MKLLLTTFLLTFSITALAQDKPVVCVSGKGTENVSTNSSAAGNKWWAVGHSESTIDAHDESMEVAKDLQKECPGVKLTLNPPNADYTVMLNRESKQKRGLLRTNNQWQVVNRVGDIVATSATRSVGSASKDACNLILADWAQHGRLAAPAPEPVATQAPQPTAAVAASTNAPPAVSSSIQAETANELQSRSDRNTVLISDGANGATGGESLAEAATRAKQHQACLKLVADNPSITCR